MAALQSGSGLASYEILALIGSGGMGEVYRARDSKLKPSSFCASASSATFRNFDEHALQVF
jgi:serine/threonine protein kinase